MAKLTNEMGLSDISLCALKETNIRTILDFLKEDPEKLSSVCSLSFKEVLQIRENLVSKYSAHSVRGTTAYDQWLSHKKLITTGVERLDHLLGGGLPNGSVLELCGTSGDGKTQLCIKVSAHVAAILNTDVIYIDTKGDFSAIRLLQIMRSKNVPAQACDAALERVSVCTVSDLHQLAYFLSSLNKSSPGLVVVDAMPPLFFPFMAAQTNKGFGLLEYVISKMKRIASEHQSVFLLVNISSVFEESKPMLGKSWLHSPHTRLTITRPASGPGFNLQVAKSCQWPVGASTHILS